MELREFLRLLQKEWKLLVGIVFLIVGGTFLWQNTQPQSYKTVVSLHIAREFDAEQQSNEYRYGDFYRLQADEKFGDTVVRWLLSPGIVLDILKGAEISSERLSYGDLPKQFQPKRLSSQFIEVRFSTPVQDEGKRIADSMRIVLNKQTSDLNVDSRKQDGWFVVVVDDPVTYLDIFDWKRSLIFSGILGIITGIWLVVGKRYFTEAR